MLLGILLMLRLGFKTAYLDESALIVHYADLYVTDMKNMGIDASIYDCVALQDESFWIRLRIHCKGTKTVSYAIGLWGQPAYATPKVFESNI
tara:strand:+ start:1464 stop:1739 length:276 start_codon:yes stop_codon:yes gene_type:complete